MDPSIKRISYALPSLALLLIPFSACMNSADESGSSQERIVHPIPAAMPGFDDAHDFEDSDGDALGNSRLQALAGILQSATEALAVGALEGDGYEVVGQIVDIEVDSDGNMYVLDSEFSEVRVYSPEGAFLYAIGGPGEGPGDFSSPRHLEVSPSGSIVVADRTREISVFEIAGETYRLAETVPLPFAPNGMCLGGGMLHVQGYATGESGIIFRFSLSGEALGSFGAGYESSSVAVSTYLNIGRVVCMERPETVMYFPQFLPAISGYSYTGEMLWQARLSEFESLEFVQDGSAASSNAFTSHDQIVGAVPLPEGHAIVQIASFTGESLRSVEGERYTELRTYLMSAQAGKAIYAGSTLPQIYAVTDEHLYTARNYPFPQLIVYRLPGRMTGSGK